MPVFEDQGKTEETITINDTTPPPLPPLVEGGSEQTTSQDIAETIKELTRPRTIPARRTLPAKKEPEKTAGPERQRRRRPQKTTEARKAKTTRPRVAAPKVVPKAEEEARHITIPSSVTNIALVLALFVIVFLVHRSIQNSRLLPRTIPSNPPEVTATTTTPSVASETAAVIPESNTTPPKPAPTPPPTPTTEPILATKIILPTPTAPAEENVTTTPPPTPAEEKVVAEAAPAPAEEKVVAEAAPAPTEEKVVAEAAPAPAEERVAAPTEEKVEAAEKIAAPSEEKGPTPPPPPPDSANAPGAADKSATFTAPAGYICVPATPEGKSNIEKPRKWQAKDAGVKKNKTAYKASYSQRAHGSDYNNPWNSGGPEDLDSPLQREKYKGTELTSRK